MKHLLEIEEFSLTLFKKKVATPILKKVSLKIASNSIVGIVGQSGSGKSMLAKSIVQLTSNNLAQERQGSIYFEGMPIESASKKRLRALRGKEIAMIFQNPISCLNPTMKIKHQVAEMVFSHYPNYPKELLHQQIVEIFVAVGINNAQERLTQYPHELSGGMLQRVMIAMMMILRPKLLIADEPTTALDATVQAQILNVLKDLQQTNQMSVLFITHDLLLANHLCDYIYVMKEGQIVEEGSTVEVFNTPKQGYTKKLLQALPPYDDLINHTPFTSPRPTEQEKVGGSV